MSLSHSLSRPTAAEAAERFLAELHGRAPLRLEARVSGPDGMPLLCAVEQALAVLPRATRQELVWLRGAPAADGHRLHLQAFGLQGELLAQAIHDIPV